MGVRGGDIWRRMGFARIAFLRWRSSRRRWRRRRRLRRRRSLRAKRRRKADRLLGMTTRKATAKTRTTTTADPYGMTTKEQEQERNGSVAGGQLVLAVAAFDGVEEFGGVVAYSIFEDDFYFFY